MTEKLPEKEDVTENVTDKVTESVTEKLPENGQKLPEIEQKPNRNRTGIELLDRGKWFEKNLAYSVVPFNCLKIASVGKMWGKY